MKRILKDWALLAAACGVCSVAGFAATSITSSSAAPATIIFAANNPDAPTVSGNLPATIIFNTVGGSNSQTWQVQIQATAANFASCPSTVAASTVRVSCTSSSASGHGATGTCSGSFLLSTFSQTVASGVEGTGNDTYTTTLSFTFTDSWSFIPASCGLGLSYTITAN